MERAERVAQIIEVADELLAELGDTAVDDVPAELADTVVEPFDPFDEPDTLTDTEIVTAVVELPPLIVELPPLIADDLDDLLESLPTAPTPAFTAPPASHLMRPITTARRSRLRAALAVVVGWFQRGGPGASSARRP